jgi:hypothetical protein
MTHKDTVWTVLSIEFPCCCLWHAASGIIDAKMPQRSQPVAVAITAVAVHEGPEFQGTEP